MIIDLTAREVLTKCHLAFDLQSSTIVWKMTVPSIRHGETKYFTYEYEDWVELDPIMINDGC